MQTLDMIFSRRSIRSYTGEKISQKDMDTLLHVANASPVGRSRYDILHMTVIEDKEFLDAIDKNGAEFLGIPKFHPLYGAPQMIVVSVNMDEASSPNVAFSNAAIMVHNITMAATDMGIGNCDIWGTIAGMNTNPALVEKLSLPEGFKACCAIILGKTEEKFERRDIPTDRVGLNYVR